MSARWWIARIQPRSASSHTWYTPWFLIDSRNREMARGFYTADNKEICAILYTSLCNFSCYLIISELFSRFFQGGSSFSGKCFHLKKCWGKQKHHKIEFCSTARLKNQRKWRLFAFHSTTTLILLIQNRKIYVFLQRLRVFLPWTSNFKGGRDNCLYQRLFFYKKLCLWYPRTISTKCTVIRQKKCQLKPIFSMRQTSKNIYW